MNIQKSFGLDFFGGKREVVDARKHKFTPAGCPIAPSVLEGPLKLCSAATLNATKEFCALIFWFVLHSVRLPADQGKMNTAFSKHDNVLCYMHIVWNSKNYMVISGKTGC